MKIVVKSLAGLDIREIDLLESVFGVTLNRRLVSEVVRYGSLSQRLCTASTKNRSEVAGSGKKRRAQKKSGRARMGERNPVHHRGGSISFGPNDRQYDVKVNKKVRKAALAMVLSEKFSNNQVIVVDNLTFDTCKTKNALKLKETFSINGRCIFVDELDNINMLKHVTPEMMSSGLCNFALSIRNVFDMFLESVHTMILSKIIHCDKFIITENALQELYVRFEGDQNE